MQELLDQSDVLLLYHLSVGRVPSEPNGSVAVLTPAALDVYPCEHLISLGVRRAAPGVPPIEPCAEKCERLASARPEAAGTR